MSFTHTTTMTQNYQKNIFITIKTCIIKNCIHKHYSKQLSKTSLYCQMSIKMHYIGIYCYHHSHWSQYGRQPAAILCVLKTPVGRKQDRANSPKRLCYFFLNSLTIVFFLVKPRNSFRCLILACPTTKSLCCSS